MRITPREVSETRLVRVRQNLDSNVMQSVVNWAANDPDTRQDTLWNEADRRLFRSLDRKIYLLRSLS